MKYRLIEISDHITVADPYDMNSALFDTHVVATGTYVIEDDGTERGIHWFKVKTVFGGTPGYEIDRLTNDGNTYGSVFPWNTYPVEFDPTSPTYSYTIRFRQ